MKYINPICSNSDTTLSKFTCGELSDIGEMSKIFLQNTKDIFYKKINIDIGNHNPRDSYIYSKLCLVHYHCRSDDQMRKKTFANITGLKYPLDIQKLRDLLDGEHLIGHHIKKCIEMLEEPENDFGPGLNKGGVSDSVLLDDLILFFKNSNLL
jgi:hypothetical protein